jgi:ABC-type polysaccharide/polyol phosphate transport system ATPase subunit
MNNDIIMSVEKVSKKFCRSLKKSMVYGITDSMKNMVGLSSHSERLRANEFWAMEDVSFELKQGESLGLIGPNGSGKTTLLKMLNGIFWPDKGKISMRGRMGALISVGAGFHPLLTGRENIYINGAILGMNKAEVDKKFDSIVNFADIGDFLDSPVKHYSSGMFVRLGFAVAVHCEPEILLVDEILAVGDMNFQSKCIDRMEELGRKGTTKIYVSHDLNSVSRICKKALYLSGGKVKGYGELAEVIGQYKKDVLQDMKENSTKNHEVRYGTQELEIVKVEFTDENDKIKEVFHRGEHFKAKISYLAHKDIVRPEFVIKFFSADGTLVSQPNTKDHKVTRESIKGAGVLEYSVSSLPLNPGRYSVTVSIWDFAGHLPFDVHEKLYDFGVDRGDLEKAINERRGLVYIPAEWKWK